MAKPHNHTRRSSSSNRSETRPTILASCYTVDARSAMLKGLHYSTTGAGGKLPHLPHWGHSGIPEVGSGIPSPPRSPPLAAAVSHDEYSSTDKATKGRTGGAAYHITEECERLFCDKLEAIFLVERETTKQESLVVGTQTKSTKYKASISEWIEVWDYASDLNFRGFVGGVGGDKSLFIFFEPNVMDKDLKPGLMALIELANHPVLACSELVICLDRLISETDSKGLIRDLGWVGFELATLAPWNDGVNDTSNEWVMLSMEI
ncbi:hypothetical protein MMC11_002587 [Xylographa trunciseda]|nr:hypothetical protein [Xylographa trunciseda]